MVYVTKYVLFKQYSASSRDMRSKGVANFNRCTGFGIDRRHRSLYQRWSTSIVDCGPLALRGCGIWIVTVTERGEIGLDGSIRLQFSHERIGAIQLNGSWDGFCGVVGFAIEFYNNNNNNSNNNNNNNNWNGRQKCGNCRRTQRPMIFVMAHVSPRQPASGHVSHRHATSARVMPRHATSCHVIPRQSTSAATSARSVFSTLPNLFLFFFVFFPVL
jgi:hypothetical protein